MSDIDGSKNNARFIVTGAGGFLGKAIATRLASERNEVHSFARGAYPELSKAGILHHRADLSSDLSEFSDVFSGADTVFHVAAKVDMWGPYDEFFRTNVTGTRNIIDMCRRCGVRKLVYTSSPSVIADGSDICGVDESYPYPAHYEAYYPQTKAIAEREVLEADAKGGLRTASLRPHLIFGPGDMNLVPTILERVRQGRMVQVGAGKNIVDFTFIDDCVEAHLCASRALDANPSAAGRAYFITQGEPVNMWDFINEIIKRSALPAISRNIPVRLALLLGSVCEGFVKLMPGNRTPFLTRFLVSEMATSHYFNISAARKELAYRPMLSMKEAMDRTFSQLL